MNAETDALYEKWRRDAQEYRDKTEPWRKNADGTLRPPPSKFCFTPSECAGRASCPRGVACSE